MLFAGYIYISTKHQTMMGDVTRRKSWLSTSIHVWSFPIIWRLFDKKNIIDKRLNMHVQSSCTHCTVSFTLFTQIKRLKKVIWHIRTCIWPNSCLIKTNKIDFLACNIIFLQQRTDINIFPIHIHATFRRRITSFHVLYFK